MRITAFEMFYCRVALSLPYVLAFTTVEAFDSFIVRASLEDGSVGMGEVVPLPGYSDETTISVSQDLKSALPQLIGIDQSSLMEMLTTNYPRSPFVISAIITAVQMAHESLNLPSTLDVPLLAPLASNPDPKILLRQAIKCISQGYRTLKLKVGRDVEIDCQSIKALLDGLPDQIALRIDANQAYSDKEAGKVLRVFEHPRVSLIECFEQPFGILDWNRFESLVREQSGVPLMLDESIVNQEDLEKAAEVGAGFVKLKLAKHKGMHDLFTMAIRAKSLGMKVIMGNGVATEIGNLSEAFAFSSLENIFHGASEGNGFIKQKWGLLKTPLLVANGALKWQLSQENASLWELKDGHYERLLNIGEPSYNWSR